MRSPFLNRSRELAQFDVHWASGRAELLVVTGRRRVGKSRLLEQFFHDKHSLHIVGTLERALLQLADATRELERVTGDPVLQAQDFSSWDALLTYLSEYARECRVGFVLDEFSYYCDASPELPSILQRWWDRRGQASDLMVVLASSHVAFMEELVLGGRALYGRRTGELRVRPFDYAEAGLFFPSYSADDRLRAYGVFGGIPAYLAACRGELSLGENMRRTILADHAYLRREPQYLLSQERSVERPMGYLSILRAIAAGRTQPSEIALAAGFRSAADIAPFLERLREFRLVERLVPITAHDGGRISRYVVADWFLAFWFRFVQPSESALEQGVDEWVLRRRIQPELDRFISRAQGPWERACHDYLWRVLRSGYLGAIGFDRLGPWWSGRGEESAEIDLVGLDGRDVTLVASCKWRNEFAKLGDLHDLRRLATRVAATDTTLSVLFSRSGFDPALSAHAERDRTVLLVTPDQMFSAEIAV